MYFLKSRLSPIGCVNTNYQSLWGRLTSNIGANIMTLLIIGMVCGGSLAALAVIAAVIYEKRDY
jgi:hypothetical protein